MALARVDEAPPDVRELSRALYAACQAQEPDKLFTQEELLDLGVVPHGDLATLVECANALGSDGLFKLLQRDNRPCWKVVSQEDAARYHNLNTEEAIVFGYVESAGREGIWTKTIRSKSNLHQIVFTRCLKSLESKGLIKPTQSAKFPTRKLYILSHLQPLEEVSGGPFFTDGAIDEEFVRVLCRWIERYIHSRSWSHTISKTPQRRKDAKASADESDAPKAQAKDKNRKRIPMPPGFIEYPRVPEITKAVNQGGISAVTMKEAEVRQLLDLLCWDGRIMVVMNGQGYKSTHATNQIEEGHVNGLVESPCGRCPVFDLCEEGGPVNARTCTYFQEWLNI